MTPTIETVWQQVTPPLRSELVAFWQRNHAMDAPAEAEKRAAQAVCVGRDADGGIWGVGTAGLGIVPSFGQPTYLYRQFFAGHRRGERLTIPFLARVRGALESYNASLPVPEAVGILFELQNDALSAYYQAMYVPEADAHFIGWSPRGRQLRLILFKGARILAPPVSRRQVAAAASRRASPGGDAG